MSRSEVPAVAPKSAAEIRRIANEVLAQFAPHCLSNPMPVPIHEILEFDACDVYDFDLAVVDLPTAVEALTFAASWIGTRSEVQIATSVYESLLEGNGRARFTAGHELGHVILHAPQLTTRFETSRVKPLYRRDTLPPYLDPEWQANQFSAELLMPRAAVAVAVREYGPNDRAIAPMFKVSYESMRIRINYLKLGSGKQP